MSEIADREDTDKPDLTLNLLGKEANEGEARVWAVGAKKYARGNWLKGMEISRAAASLIRHLMKFLNGENNDNETGLPHVDHIVCCAKILSQSYHIRKNLDDRPSTQLAIKTQYSHTRMSKKGDTCQS